MRRSGVTVTVGDLEQAGLVTHVRGFVRVESQAEMAAAACGCYGLLADGYGKFINELADL